MYVMSDREVSKNFNSRSSYSSNIHRNCSDATKSRYTNERSSEYERTDVNESSSTNDNSNGGSGLKRRCHPQQDHNGSTNRDNIAYRDFICPVTTSSSSPQSNLPRIEISVQNDAPPAFESRESPYKKRRTDQSERFRSHAETVRYDERDRAANEIDGTNDEWPNGLFMPIHEGNTPRNLQRNDQRPYYHPPHFHLESISPEKDWRECPIAVDDMFSFVRHDIRHDSDSFLSPVTSARVRPASSFGSRSSTATAVTTTSNNAHAGRNDYFDPHAVISDRDQRLLDALESSCATAAGSADRKITHSPWTERLKEMLAYKATYGDCLVPQKFAGNPQLGSWVNKQRVEYKLMKEGKRSSMTEERVRILEEVGFVWSKNLSQPSWECKFLELTRYLEAHGDCLVPTKYAENPSLGRWVSTQRAQYKIMKEGGKSSMTEDRMRRLDEIGFVWRLHF